MYMEKKDIMYFYTYMYEYMCAWAKYIKNNGVLLQYI
jgi:hypothetical protein